MLMFLWGQTSDLCSPYSTLSLPSEINNPRNFKFHPSRSHYPNLDLYFRSLLAPPGFSTVNSNSTQSKINCPHITTFHISPDNSTTIYKIFLETCKTSFIPLYSLPLTSWTYNHQYYSPEYLLNYLQAYLRGISGSVPDYGNKAHIINITTNNITINDVIHTTKGVTRMFWFPSTQKSCFTLYCSTLSMQ